MHQNTEKQTGNTFDGLPILVSRNRKAPAEGGSVPSLDLGTLKDNTPPSEHSDLPPILQDLRSCAHEYGMVDAGGGTGRNWTVTVFADGTIEVIGLHTEEGLRKPPKRKTGKRATARKDMDDSNVERALRRTKKNVRGIAMQLQPDTLLTFTTRAAIVEAAVFKAIVTRFLRLCRAEGVLTEYLAVFERHMGLNTSAAKYGSLHLHVAIRGFVRYDLLRKLWRDAVQWKLRNGDYEGAGFDASRRGRGHTGGKSIARYIAKYISKDMDDEYFEPNKKRYWASKGIEKPLKIRFFSPPATHYETFRAMWEEIIGLDIEKVFQPDRVGGQPPLIWMSTG